LQLEGVSATEVFDPQSAPVTRVNDTANTPETEPLARLPVVWPWLALIGVLVLAAGGVMIAIIVSLVSEQSPSPSPSSISVSKQPNPPAPNRPIATVSVFLADVVGKKVIDATAFLTQKGLLVEAVPGEALDPTDSRILGVYQAEGLGQIPVGSTVRLFYYIQGESAPITSPSPTVTPSPSPSISPSPSPSSSGG
jgi:serine/threonine-protein kinase